MGQARLAAVLDFRENSMCRVFTQPFAFRVVPLQRTSQVNAYKLQNNIGFEIFNFANLVLLNTHYEQPHRERLLQNQELTITI